MKLVMRIKAINYFIYRNMGDSYSIKIELEIPCFLITGICHSITDKPCKTFHMLYINVSQRICVCFNLLILCWLGKAIINIQV